MSANVNTTPSTSFEKRLTNYGGRKAIEYRQRVQPTLGAPNVSLGFNVPPYARVIHVAMSNNAVATVTGTGAGATADAIHLVMYPITAATGATLTAPPATVTVKSVAVTNGSTSGILLGSIGIGTSEGLGTNAGKFRGLAIQEICTSPILAKNPWSNEAYLALVPGLISSGSFQVNGIAITSGFVFGTGSVTGSSTVADVFVTMYVETYDDNPAF